MATTEYPDNNGVGSAFRLQRCIMEFVDSQHLNGLRELAFESGDDSSLRRLDELSHKDVDHTWLWRQSSHRGARLDEREYVEAVRVRLGNAGPDEVVPCALCGESLLDPAGAHALCCSKAEAIRGHRKVAKVILNAAQRCDPSAEPEVLGLIPGTNLRLADFLTRAAGPGLTALDIGITSPDATHAGDDCIASLYQEKINHHTAHLDTLDRQNIAYQPLVWSAYGRPHSRTTAILRILAKRISRRRGCSDEKEVYRRLRGDIGVEIARRAAKHVMSCWPNPDCMHDG